MNNKVLIRNRALRALADRPQKRPLEDSPPPYRTVPDFRLLIAGIILGMLVMLIIFSSTGLLQELWVALGLVAEALAIHWLALPQA
ncbi:MAG: hypothetical protein KF803_03880 [Cyclobacteriaceae bacterium]|nr:hypothetical protein [Cyclobacteriaceae bacterium]